LQNGRVSDRAREVVRGLLDRPDAPAAATPVLAALGVLEVLNRQLEGGQLATAVLLAVFGIAPLALAPARVVLATAGITFATLVSLVGGIPLSVAAWFAQFAAGYLLGRLRPWRIALPGVLPFLIYAAARPDTRAVLLLALVAGAVVLGAALREHAEALARRWSGQAIADTLLEHAARGERARIARDLHDVVAHHISLIAVQAETARLTTPGLPPDGARRLSAIGDTARQALTEMRRLLGVLREDAGAAPTRSPQPGLDQLNELIDGARESAGASTRLIVRGCVGPLDSGVELTAYRIIQEALTNARRHAPGAAVDVELIYAGEELRVRVRDNGPGPPGGPESGHGLLGMRERAGMVGGTLRAGPGPLGGFLVEVTLPATETVS
jgi:signal transduction histidine kinase